MNTQTVRNYQYLLRGLTCQTGLVCPPDCQALTARTLRCRAQATNKAGAPTGCAGWTQIEVVKHLRGPAPLCWAPPRLFARVFQVSSDLTREISPIRISAKIL